MAINLKKFLIFLLLLVLPFGQLTRLPLKIPGVNVYFHDVVVFLLLFIFLIEKALVKKKFTILPLCQPVLALFCFALFSLILSLPQRQLNESIIAFLYLIRYFVYASVYFIVGELKKSFQLKIKDLMLIGIVFSAFLGLLQYIFLPDVSALKGFNWDPHYFRIISTFLDPGYTGLIYVLGLILIFESLLSVKKIKTNFNWRLVLVVFFILTYSALALTYSRASYLAYLMAIIVIAFFKKSVKFFTLLLFLAGITLFLLPHPGGEGVKLRRQSTINARINNFKQTIRISLDYPLFGVGFNNFRYIKRDYGFLSQEKWQASHSGAGADCSFLFILATTGILGLISFIWLIAKALLQVLKIKHMAGLAYLLALLVHSFFNNSLFYAWTMLYFWILLAIGEPFREYKKP